MRCAVCGLTTPWEKTDLAKFERKVRETGCTYGAGWTNSESNWACAVCLGNGQALPANPSRQDFGGLGSPPFLAYWDRQLHCQYCNQDWVFTAEEQLFWYEGLGVHVRAYPTGCKQCRKKVRLVKDAQQSLMELLPQLDPTDPDQLTEAAELSYRTGNPKRALEFLRRAKNKARDDQQRISLLARIDQVVREGAPAPPQRRYRSSLWSIVDP